MTHDEHWIEIPNWGKFQHYKDRRAPWIKNYTELLFRESYVQLPGHLRGVLHGIWMLYASTPEGVSANPHKLTEYLHMKVTREHLARLNQAGYIEIVASTHKQDNAIDPLALARARPETETETETETEPPLTPPRGGTGSRDNGTNPRAQTEAKAAIEKEAKRRAGLQRMTRQWLQDEVPTDSILDELVHVHGMAHEEAHELLDSLTEPAEAL